MAERKLIVVVAGDDRSLQRTLNRATQSVNKFGQNTAKGTQTFSRGLEPLLANVRKMKDEAGELDERLSKVGSGSTVVRAAKLGAGFFALGAALEGAGAGLEAVQGHASETSNSLNDAGKAIQSLITLNPAGFFEAVGARAKRTREEFERLGKGLEDANDATRKLDLANTAARIGLEDVAKKLREEAAAATAAATSVRALEFAQREFNVTVIDGVSALVAFKGAADDVGGLRGPTLAESITVPTPAGRRSLRPLSPSERREVELLAREGGARLPGLRDRLSQLQGADPRTHAGLLRNRERIAQTEREISGILKDQARARQAAAEAAARDAEAARREAAERARLARERAASLEQIRQFRLIGLSPSGGEITPTTGNLFKQLTQLDKSLVGEDVPTKLTNRLAGVRKALAKGLGDLKEPTRAAIRDLFETIRSEFEKGTKEGGPLTKTTSINTNRLLNGLGIGPEAERELRARLAGVNSAGRMLSGKQRATGSFVGGPATVVQSNTTVTLDGEVVGRSTKRSSEKDSRRNPKQKVGPWAGR